MDDDLKLSEAQSRYFGDLFLCCCDTNEENLSYEKAIELFRSANINADLVRQILRIAQIGENVSHSPTTISRRKFYSCLKLISACQSGLAPALLSSETLHEDISPMALPRFSWFGANDVNRSGEGSTAAAAQTQSAPPPQPPPPLLPNGNSSANGPNSSYQDDRMMSMGKAAPPDLIELSQGERRPSKGHKTGSSSSVGVTVEQPSTDSEVEQNDDSSAIENSDGHRHKYGGSPSAWSTGSGGSESPTPTNSVAVKGGKANLWHGLLCEEQRQLLGTEEESSDRHSSDDDPTEDSHAIHANIHNAGAPSSTSSTLRRSDDDLLYAITEDQRAYYTKQYQTVQKDGVGNVTGPVARVFFEKSRIPVEELRHVWKLCDATKDGALSQAEFMAAMHLVVLRRNGIELPVRLPRCLHADSILRGTSSGSSSQQAQTLQEADLLHLNDDCEEENRQHHHHQHQHNHLDETSCGGDIENSINGPESINSVIEDHHPSRQHLPPVAARTGVTAPPPPLAMPMNSSSVAATGPETGDWNNLSQTAWTKFNESPTNGATVTSSTSATTASVSSPGPKPVHFDIQWTVQAVGADPQILHPVALRLTPQGAEAVTTTTSNSGSGSGSGGTRTESSTSPTPTMANASSKSGGATTSGTSTGEFRPIQRPQAKKVKQVGNVVGGLPPPPVRDSQNIMNMSIDSASVLTSRGGEALSSSPDDDGEEVDGAGGVDGRRQGSSSQHPPIPPPRQPITRHTRSSSLDLNKLLLQSGTGSGGGGGTSGNVASMVVTGETGGLLPAVPPRETPQAIQAQHSCDSKLESTFADFTMFSGAGGVSKPQPFRSSPAATSHRPMIPSKRQSAFEVYRKPIPSQVSPIILDQEKKVAHLEEMLRNLNLIGRGEAGVVAGARINAPETSVQQLRDQNAVLANVCLELGHELFALKYKREELAQRLQQVDAINHRTIEATTANSGSSGAGRGMGVGAGAAAAVTQASAVTTTGAGITTTGTGNSGGGGGGHV